ncbi:CapA family protein [Chelativorans sp. AA-79]|uniref:CapA family protein n=1 Tax=Chelativorans sp. AA-79 TaxID=3028735 RepID=UPI0023FA35E3|nr:CapA family protein [Chelativorans sp. AA-79]WEX08256.1 CapA family protein [Chelativorans sp. AA-79]
MKNIEYSYNFRILDKAERRQESLDVPARHVTPHPSDVIIAWGGDVNLGRRQHYITKEVGEEKVLDINALKSADLSIVNLECVVSTKGRYEIEKGEPGPYYYRARPEMLQILRHAGVQMVAVANNHSGDYGDEALVEQAYWLRTFGLKFAGSGLNISEAFSPAYSQAGPFKVALFSVDSTQHRFAATDNSPGIAYLDPKKPEIWLQTLKALIAEARTNADIVLVAVHWGNNWATMPDDAEIAIGHAIIDAGADAILGASAHVLQGIEVYKGKPIIHDAGDLLFDSKLPERGAGVFRLHLDRKGIHAVSFVPIRTAFGRTYQLPPDRAAKTSVAFRDLCLQLGTDLALQEDGAAKLIIREQEDDLTVARTPPPKHHRAPDAEIASALAEIDIRSEWTVVDVPADARLEEPLRIGPLTLLGLRCRPRDLTGRAMVWVESFWICEEKLVDNWRLDIRAVSKDAGSPVVWGAGMDHDPCDWMLPTSKWQPQQIYRDYFGLRPPTSKAIRSTDLLFEVCLVGRDGKTDPVCVPNRTVHIELPSPSPIRRPSFARSAISRDQRQPVPISRCRFSFLNVDMGWQRTGVENASILRVALFSRELGISPYVLTSRYNPQLRRVEEYLRATGQLPDGVLFRNMYDDYQSADSFDADRHLSADLLRPELHPEQEWRAVPNTDDHRVFTRDGRKLMYVARRKDTGRIGYVNHFHDNFKWRRDVYDFRGFLSCIQMLDGKSARVVQEIFLRPGGSIALIKSYTKDQGNIDHIQVVEENGHLCSRVKDESELMRLWLNEFVNEDDLHHVFIVDKSRILYAPAVDVRDMQPDKGKITVIPVVHALHTRDHRRVEDGRENRNYIEILKDIRRPDAIVTLTEEQKTDIVNRYGPAPIDVIGHAYNSQTTPGCFERRDRYKVVYLARYSPEKEHNSAIRAFRLVVNQVPNATLHCYGFGNPGDPTLPALEKLVKDLHLGSNVFLNGWAQETASVYEGAGLTILTSQAEAFSLTIMESLCHGCPAIAFDVRYGPRALIRHGYNGFLVPFGDEKALAQYIVGVLEDETLHRLLSSQARQDAARFSPSLTAHSWSKLFSSLSITGCANKAPNDFDVLPALSPPIG